MFSDIELLLHAFMPNFFPASTAYLRLLADTRRQNEMPEPLHQHDTFAVGEQEPRLPTQILQSTIP